MNKGLQKIQANRARERAEREKRRDARRQALEVLNERLGKLGLPAMQMNGLGTIMTTPQEVAAILDYLEKDRERS